MLTRSQVASRLGRSLATVRRLEGHVLHPTKDANGVNRFDDAGVNAAARMLSERSDSAAWVLDPPPEDGQRKPDNHVVEPGRELVELRTRLELIVRKLAAETDRAERAEKRVSAFEATIAAELLSLGLAHPEASRGVERALNKLSRL